MHGVRITAVSITAVLALGTIPAAAGNPWEPTTGGGWVSGPVEHLATIAQEAGTAIDAVVHDDHLYVTTWRSFSIYDISDPRDPQRLATEPLVTGMIGEEPQTNGEILLISRDTRMTPPGSPVRVGGVLDIYDVRDKTDPTLIGTYESTRTDHLWACVFDCDYAYSATGTILDLRDPTEPTAVGDWSQVADYRGWHHIAEVAPGLVLTGTVPMFLLDAADDPTAPTVLAEIDVPVTVPEFSLSANETALPARVAWPQQAEDRYAIVSMETPFKGQCSDQAGEVLTFDTDGWEESGTFEHVDRFQIADNGTYTDGNSPYNALGCSAYGLDTHTAWGDDGRLAAVTFFEHGLRILAVDDQGSLGEIGGFIPLAGNSTAVRWGADDLLYVIDLHRGIDILEIDLDALE
jgi:hypothetical protein